MKDCEAFKRATSAALRFLSYRARSEAEVRTRLLRRFPPRTIDLVLEDLKRQDLIDDSKFADLWKQSRDAHRPRSAFLIRRELMAKGVAQEVASQAVADIDDADAAYRAGQKFARRLRGLEFQKYSARVWGHLRRRGFNSSISREIAFRLWSEHTLENESPANSASDGLCHTETSEGCSHA